MPSGPRRHGTPRCFLERVAADETHRVVRPAISVRPQAIDWHNPWMLERASDLCLDVGKARLIASSACWSRICLSATSRFSSPSSATKMAPRPPRAWGRRTRNRWPSPIVLPAEKVVVRSASASDSLVCRTGADSGESSLDFAVAQCGEVPEGRSSGGNRGQALLGAAAMFLFVKPDHRLDGTAARRRPGRRGRPGSRQSGGPCRDSRPGTRRQADPDRSGRSGGQTTQRGGCDPR